MRFYPSEERVNRDKKGFATKQRMFGLLIIDEGPSLSMTNGRAVAHFKLVCEHPKGAKDEVKQARRAPNYKLGPGGPRNF